MVDSCGVKDCKVVKVDSISISGSDQHIRQRSTAVPSFPFMSFTDGTFKTENTNTHACLSFKDVSSSAGFISFEIIVSEGHD